MSGQNPLRERIRNKAPTKLLRIQQHLSFMSRLRVVPSNCIRTRPIFFLKYRSLVNVTCAKSRKKWSTCAPNATSWPSSDIPSSSASTTPFKIQSNFSTSWTLRAEGKYSTVWPSTVRLKKRLQDSTSAKSFARWSFCTDTTLFIAT